MITEIKRVVDMNTQKVFKLITIKTNLNETVFEGKLYTDSVIFKEIIDEESVYNSVIFKEIIDKEALLKELESIPNLLKS